MDVEKQIHLALEQFSRGLIPSEDYVQRGTAAAQEIFELLKTEEEEGKKALSIDRNFISGSMGKKTALINSDFDCVVFVNIKNITEIEGVLVEFQKILLRSGLGLKAFKKTRFSVQFKYQEIELDILPAINLINREAKQLGDPERGAEMAFRVLEKIAQQPSLSYSYSSALTETTLRFMRGQSSFIHDLVRLAKHWNKSVTIDGYISGRSTLIEVVAVRAGREEETFKEKNYRWLNAPPCLLNSFRKFLLLIAGFPEMKIKFEFEEFDPLSPLRSSRSYPWLQPRLNSKKKPVIRYAMDPANPFNNLCKGVRPPVRRRFREAAKLTLQRLDYFIQNWPTTPIDTIFVPQKPTKNSSKTFKAST